MHVSHPINPLMGNSALFVDDLPTYGRSGSVRHKRDGRLENRWTPKLDFQWTRSLSERMRGMKDTALGRLGRKHRRQRIQGKWHYYELMTWLIFLLEMDGVHTYNVGLDGERA